LKKKIAAVNLVVEKQCTLRSTMGGFAHRARGQATNPKRNKPRDRQIKERERGRNDVHRQ